MPALDKLQVSEGYDEKKEKPYIDLRFEDVIIREYLPEFYRELDLESQKAAMKQLVMRARFRMATAIKYRDDERAKIKATREKVKKLTRAK